MIHTKAIGLDVARGYVVACAMDSLCPDLPEFIRQYKPIKATATPEGVKEITALGELFFLEPTGKDHRWWQEQLEAHHKVVMVVSGMRIRNHARERGVLSKGDKEDAAAIASYGLTHLTTERSFLDSNASARQLRDLRRQIKATQAQRTTVINQLKARLGEEDPEHCKFAMTPRQFGEGVRAQWQRLIDELTISHTSREDLELIILLEKREVRLETEARELLKQPCFSAYCPVWENWKISEKIYLPILGAIYPIEQFLRPDGKRMIRHIYSKDEKRVKNDQTLRGIHRALGYGRVKYQSGDSWKWGRTGDQEVLSALFLWAKLWISIKRTPNRTRLFKLYGKPAQWEAWGDKKRKAWIESHNFRAFCIERQPECDNVKSLDRHRQRRGYLPWKDAELIEAVANYSLVSERIAQLQIYYEFGTPAIKQDERVLKVIPLLIRLLTKDLIATVQPKSFQE